jgi:hypothetical protein
MRKERGRSTPAQRAAMAETIGDVRRGVSLLEGWVAIRVTGKGMHYFLEGERRSLCGSAWRDQQHEREKLHDRAPLWLECKRCAKSLAGKAMQRRMKDLHDAEGEAQQDAMSY